MQDGAEESGPGKGGAECAAGDEPRRACSMLWPWVQNRERTENDMLLQSKALHKLHIVKFLFDGLCCIECAISNKFYMLGAWDGIFFMGRIGSI